MDKTTLLLDYLRKGEPFCRKLHVAEWFDLISALADHDLLMVNAELLMRIAPRPAAQKIAKLYGCHIATIRTRLKALKDFSRAASENNLHFLLFKGIAASYQIYDNPYARDSGDVDIFVAADDLPKADWILRSLGWVQPAEAYRVRRLINSGVADASSLQAGASPYPLRSSLFLPHVTNYYYAHPSGQIDSLEVHDRYYGLPSKFVSEILWSGDIMPVGNERFSVPSFAMTFILSALSLYEDAESVRSNTSTRSDLGLKTCFDLHVALGKMDDADKEKVRIYAQKLGIVHQLAVALCHLVELIPQDSELAQGICDLGESCWVESYPIRCLEREKSGPLAVERLRKIIVHRTDNNFLLSTWHSFRPLSTPNGICDSPFFFQAELVESNKLLITWSLPNKKALFVDRLCFQSIAVVPNQNNESLGLRVNAFTEKGAWKTDASEMGVNTVDGHANRIRKGFECSTEAIDNHEALQIRVLVPLPLRHTRGVANRLIVVPSVHEQIVGQIFRIVAGTDFITYVQKMMNFY